MAATYEPIATTTLGSASSTIDFNSIAASWTDLRLVLSVPTSATDGGDFGIRFNSDSGNNYSLTELGGNGTGAVSGRMTSFSSYRVSYNTNGTSTTYPFLITMDLFSYAGSTYKTALSTVSNDRNGGAVVAVSNTVGLWRSTSAVTSINIFSSYNMNIGTKATLYGIKAA